MIRFALIFGLAALAGCQTPNEKAAFALGELDRPVDKWVSLSTEDPTSLPALAVGETYKSIDDVITAAGMSGRELSVEAEKRFGSLYLTLTTSELDGPATAEKLEIDARRVRNGHEIKFLFKTRDCGQGWTTDLCPAPSPEDAPNAAY